jgi:hypothetical protein
MLSSLNRPYAGLQPSRDFHERQNRQPPDPFRIQMGLWRWPLRNDRGRFRLSTSNDPPPLPDSNHGVVAKSQPSCGRFSRIELSTYTQGLRLRSAAQYRDRDVVSDRCAVDHAAMERPVHL